ncbi:MAG: hypothetical protein ACXWMI_00080 [Syntrophales bacterium]
MKRSSRAFLELIQSNLAFVIYCVLFLMLFSSVVLESGSTYLGYLVLYFAVLVVAYFTFSRLIGIFLSGFLGHGKMEVSRNGWPKSFFGTAFLICAVLFVIAHFIYLGHVPILTASLEDGYYNIMLVRQSIFFEAPAFYRYVPNLLVKSVFPILLLYFFLTSKKKFWITIVVGSFYAVALLNKMFIVLLVIPLSIYFISGMKVWRTLFLSIVPVAGVMLIVFAQNPMIRPTLWSDTSYQLSNYFPQSLEIESVKRTLSYREKIPVSESAGGFVDTIYRRVFLVPGQVVSAWFRRIPADIPFAEGCASRPVAWLKGCEFIFLPRLINDLENPVLLKKGIYGTMTAASFMEDYGNFGWKGLILGGLSLGLVLAIVGLIFGTSWRWLLAFNLIPISLLIELPLTTVLLSGGWLLSLLLYLVFHYDLERTVVDPAGSK